MTAAERAAAATEQVWDAVQTSRAVNVDSPPGAGKSMLVREIARRAAVKAPVPIVTQTNNQADDMVVEFAREARRGLPAVRVGRLHGETYRVPAAVRADPSTVCSNQVRDLHDCDVIVAPARKWAWVDDRTFRFGIIDECYQMRSDDLMPIGAIVDALLTVGDPGQIDPFSLSDETIVRGLEFSPIDPAAYTMMTSQPHLVRLALPVSWRLAPHTAGLVSDAFYAEPFEPALPDDARTMTSDHAANTDLDEIVRHAAHTGWAYAELPPQHLPRTDRRVADTIAGLVRANIEARFEVSDETGRHELHPSRIAVGVTHNDQADLVRALVVQTCRDFDLPHDTVSVGTANTLQGREFDAVIVWHPLSGRRDATQFHLDAGRLCVLLSRHRHSCIVVARGGIEHQLMAYPSTEPVWAGERPAFVDGWQAHLRVLDHLARHRREVA